MRSFKVPFDMNEKEKIVGGYFTLQQTGYGLLSLTLIFISMFSIGGSLTALVKNFSAAKLFVKLSLSIVFAVSGLLFMYCKPHGMSFLRYLTIYVRYMVKEKRVLYHK